MTRPEATPRARLAAALGLATALLLAAVATAAAPADSIDAGADTPRIVAIGDVHGALEPFRALLRQADLIDAEDRWIGGHSILVQTGDVTDRGAEVRGVIALLAKLETEAEAAGGRVVALLGNHEGMNLARVYRDVGPEAYAQFADAQSDKRRERAWDEWRKLARDLAARRGLHARFSSETKRTWFEAHPAGLLEYRAAVEPDGELGAWMRSRPTVARVGDTLFVHGGIGPELAGHSLEEINSLVAGEIASHDALRESLAAAGEILPFFDRATVSAVLRQSAGLDDAEAGGGSEVAARALDELEGLGETWMFREGGPLWFRGYARWSDEELAPLVEAQLSRHGVRRIVAGHTPTEASRIQRRLEDRLILIDTGMYWSEEDGPGRASALEIARGQLREIYVGEEAQGEEMPPAGAMMPLSELLAATAPPPAVPLGVPERHLVGPDGEPLRLGSDEEILEFLSAAEVVDWSYVGEGVTRPRRLVLEKDGYRLRAIFHDVDVVKDRVRLPGRGMVLNYKDSYRSQVAAYHVAIILGLDNVPPAVVRDWGRERGSAALWIEGAHTEGARLASREEPQHPLDYHRRFYDLRVFDNLINNTDRNQGNIVFDAQGKFWFVDHTRSFGVNDILPDPQLVTRCSRSLWEALNGLSEQAVDARLSELLTRSERKALLKRRDRIVRLLTERIAELGEEDVLFEHGAPPAGVSISVEP